jgi:hypothetical protein
MYKPSLEQDFLEQCFPQKKKPSLERDFSQNRFLKRVKSLL